MNFRHRFVLAIEAMEIVVIAHAVGCYESGLFIPGSSMMSDPDVS